MKIIFILMMMFFITTSLYSQTMIEMSHPADADIVLIEVKDTADADVIIYLSNNKYEYNSWDCMWKIKTWGHSNFSFYLAESKEDPFLNEEDYNGHTILVSGKVYFTTNKDDRGYKNNKVHLDGVMKVNRNE